MMIIMKATPIVRIKDLHTNLSSEKLTVKFVSTVISIIDKPEDKLVSIMVEDDTGQIELRIFGEKRDRRRVMDYISIGDHVLVIGEVRRWGGEVYVIPKNMRKIDEAWVKYYKLRLERYQQKISQKTR